MLGAETHSCLLGEMVELFNPIDLVYLAGLVGVDLIELVDLG